MQRLGAITCLLVVSAAVGAEAEPTTTKTTQAVVLRKKPGEKEAVVAKLPAGTTVAILAEEGRWLKVRVGSKVGYLARTTVTPTNAPSGGPTGSWSAEARADPTSLTSSTLSQSAETRAGTEETGTDAELEVVPQRARTVRIGVGLGYRNVGLDFSSNGTGGLANYVASAAAAAVGVDAEATMRLTGRWFVGADGRFAASLSSPGLDYPGPSGPAGQIPFSTVAFDGGVRAGGHVQMFDLAARVGGHYDAFLVRDVDNVGTLPRERLLGATLGVRAAVMPARSRIDAEARFDWLALGSRAQTPGLEDGTNSSAHAMWGGATLRFRLARHLALLAAYDFGRATTSWSGMSTRAPGATRAHRVDTSQQVQIGVSGEL